MSNHIEEWRPVPGYPFYKVSSIGRVLGLKRNKILKPISNRGYLVVKLGHPNLAYGIHQLVCAAFIGNGVWNRHLVVNHINGIKTDNRPENLEYVTISENTLHQYRTGLLSNIGEHCGRCKVTDAQIEEIRSSSESNKTLARKYGLHYEHLRKIRTGKCRPKPTPQWESKSGRKKRSPEVG